MERYIDADELIKKIFPYEVIDKKSYAINAKAVYEAIKNAPTADVVPRSEADEIAEELSDTIVMKDELFDEVIKLRCELAKVKSEVAREIFEEIENLMLICACDYGHLHREIRKFKRRYKIEKGE